MPGMHVDRNDWELGFSAALCELLDSPCTRWSTGFDRKTICLGSSWMADPAPLLSVEPPMTATSLERPVPATAAAMLHG
ncbi:MAG: hypothetical protein ABIQ55_00070 [Gemmatimonadaceae bacterium]